MAIKFEVTVDEARLSKIIRDKQKRMAAATEAALREASADAVAEGRKNIAGAGRFGGKWQSKLQYRIVSKSGMESKSLIFHSFGLAGVFEHGATIQGKPLLWIPIEKGGPPASRSGKKLTSATVRGQPVLFDANDPDRHRKPLYIGVPSVRIPKKFRIIEIVKEHAKQISELFVKHFKGD